MTTLMIVFLPVLSHQPSSVPPHTTTQHTLLQAHQPYVLRPPPNPHDHPPLEGVCLTTIGRARSLLILAPPVRQLSTVSGACFLVTLRADMARGAYIYSGCWRLPLNWFFGGQAEAFFPFLRMLGAVFLVVQEGVSSQKMGRWKEERTAS
jgi:hypothetical protein